MPVLRLLLIVGLLVVSTAASRAFPTAEVVFLVAKPELRSPYFRHSVVLVTRHGQDAAVGVILNRPTDVPVSRLLKEGVEVPGGDQPLYLGGPVDRHRTVFLRRSGQPLRASLHLVDDIYMSESIDVFDDALRAGLPASELRVFKGFASWAPGQLEGEIERGDWLVFPVDPDLVFADPDGLWEQLVAQHQEGLWVEQRPVPSYAEG